jgi:uroporphyrinogen-III synthase
VTASEQSLAGRRIVVTRTRAQAAGIVDLLHGLGATVAVIPLISTVPIATPDEIVQTAAAVRAAPAPRWVAFTSATAVRLVVGAAGAEALSGMLVASVGAATATAIADAGVRVDLVATPPDGAGLADAMLAHGVDGAAVWFPAAEGASRRLVETLTAGGADVTVQVIYRSAMPDAAPLRLRAALRDGVDAITLTSGSTARNLAAILGNESLPPRVSIVCIGEQTAAEARAAGLPVHGVAATASSEGLVDALTERLCPQPLP